MTRRLRLTSIEKRMLAELQSRFPLTPRPFRNIGRKLGISEEEAVGIARSLARHRVIRSIGAALNGPRLGLRSTLVAMRVPRRRIRMVARIINTYPQATHNYLRNDPYNVWFTLSAASQGELGALLKEIKRKTGVRDALDLRTVRVHKITAVFPPRMQP